MSLAECSRHTFRIVGRSFMAFVLTPSTPLDHWIADLDAWIARSQGFFEGRPLIVDFTGQLTNELAVTALLLQLKDRKLRVVAVEGVNPDWLGDDLKPIPGNGKDTGLISVVGDDAPADPAPPPAPRGPTSLLVDTSVRSGQSIVCPTGDIIVTGSVASGAELAAAGSIHVYGTLRGRALAGCKGDANAHIFCNALEAELLAINGYYRTAEDFDLELQGRQVQAWLEGEVMKTAIQGC